MEAQRGRSFTQGHTASEKRSLGLNPGLCWGPYPTPPSLKGLLPTSSFQISSNPHCSKSHSKLLAEPFKKCFHLVFALIISFLLYRNFPPFLFAKKSQCKCSPHTRVNPRLTEADSAPLSGERVEGQPLATASCGPFSQTLAKVHTHVWLCDLMPLVAKAPDPPPPISQLPTTLSAGQTSRTQAEITLQHREPRERSSWSPYPCATG